jgi:hypothetical protein
MTDSYKKICELYNIPMLCYLTKVGKSQYQSGIREVAKRKLSVCFGGNKEKNSDSILNKMFTKDLNKKATRFGWQKNEYFCENISFKYGLFI